MDTKQLPVEQKAMKEEVLKGLRKDQKELPSKYFYDTKGSWLFDRICDLKEYYPTRTEFGILKDHIEQIARRVGPKALLIEYGSGSSSKTHILLDHLEDLAAYIPIDISKEHLYKATNRLENQYPELDIQPLCADYTGTFEIPAIEGDYERRVIFYPGSTIGNFTPPEARRFLDRMADLLDEDGGILIGVDLKKDRQTLIRAYDDEKGVTAAFNKNVLENINRELEAGFDLEEFEHHVRFNEQEGRIEMHLKSLADQRVSIDGEQVEFEKGETIHTENSYKYTLEEFKQLVSDPLNVEEVWTDEKELFSVQFLTLK